MERRLWGQLEIGERFASRPTEAILTTLRRAIAVFEGSED
jgi:hypothetical protein